MIEMREALLGFSLVFIAYFVEFDSATVVLKPFSISFPDLPAKFARGMNNTSVCGALELADPLDACTRLRNEFGSNRTDPIRFALIIRGDCSFEDKIRNSQSVGFSAAIVYDDKDRGNLVYMMVNPKGIKVLAVFVSKSAGEFLKKHAKRGVLHIPAADWEGLDSFCYIYLITCSYSSFLGDSLYFSQKLVELSKKKFSKKCGY